MHRLACRYPGSVVLGLFPAPEDGEWREKAQGPRLARQQLIPPAGRLDRGGLPQDGGAPRDRPSLDSAIARICAESALAGAPTPTQGDATPEASRATSAHSGGVARHRCKRKGLGEAGQPCQERIQGLQTSVSDGNELRQWCPGKLGAGSSFSGTPRNCLQGSRTD